jgi:cytochrome c553
MQSRWTAILWSVALAVGAVNAAAQALPAPQAVAASPLPAAPAREAMLRVCSTCHSPDIVAQQRLAPDGWKDLVNKMADQGATASEAELAEITAYLSASFPPDVAKESGPKQR